MYFPRSQLTPGLLIEALAEINRVLDSRDTLGQQAQLGIDAMCADYPLLPTWPVSSRLSGVIPAQGCTLDSNQASQLITPFGELPAQRLFTHRRPREETVTYWFTVGDKAVQGKLQRRLVELSYGLTGHIPDDLLFRVSLVDRNQTRANSNVGSIHQRTASYRVPHRM